MLLKKEFIFITFALILALSNAMRSKRMYALCPPHFIRLGTECYFFSTERVNWLDAHFNCKDRNSRLAEPVKLEDRKLRKYLLHGDQSRNEKWIGGIYNWEKNKWQWGYNGRDLSYQSFSQMIPGQDLRFHCAVLNPELKYRWSARSCVDKHNYICQHRMPYVSEKNREKVYSKWNETYPNEMANEVEVVINEDDRMRNNRQNYRQLSKTAQTRSNRPISYRNDQLLYENGHKVPPQRRISNRPIKFENSNQNTVVVSRRKQQREQNRRRLRPNRKNVLANAAANNTSRSTSGFYAHSNGIAVVTNDIFRKPIVQYASDSRNENQLDGAATSISEVSVSEPNEHKRRRMQQKRQDRMQRRRKTTTMMTTSYAPTEEPEVQQKDDAQVQEREDQRIFEENIKKEQIARQDENERRQEEQKLRDHEQIRLEETRKKLEDEAERNKQIYEENIRIENENREKELKRRDEELKRREEEEERRQIELKNRGEEEKRRQAELKNREEEEVRRQIDLKNREEEAARRKIELKNREEEENRRKIELKNREDEEKLRLEEIKDRETEAQIREAQEKVRQQELKNREIEERIRQNEEKKRQQELKNREAELQAREAEEETIQKQESANKSSKDGDEQTQPEDQVKIEDARIEERRKINDGKRLRRDQLRKRLQNLNPEIQRKFFEQRAERNKKRGVAITENDTVIPQ